MITGGFVFIFGLIFGSFLNAWEYRIESKMSLGGRSTCPKCKKKIAWHDNIPLVSWIILRGKCRHCRKPISKQYPAVELITAVIFVLLWFYSGPGIALSTWLDGIYNPSVAGQVSNQFPIIELISFLLLTAYFFLLVLVALYDAKTKYVLSKYAYIAAGLGLTYTLLQLDTMPTLVAIYPYFLAILIPTGLFWGMAHFSKERFMGKGDAEIALAIGCTLGWPQIIPAYYLAFIVGAAYGISVLARRKGNLKSEVPFGPFLIAGALFGFVYGAQIFDWYTRIVFGI